MLGIKGDIQQMLLLLPHFTHTFKSLDFFCSFITDIATTFVQCPSSFRGCLFRLYSPSLFHLRFILRPQYKHISECSHFIIWNAVLSISHFCWSELFDRWTCEFFHLNIYHVLWFYDISQAACLRSSLHLKWDCLMQNWGCWWRWEGQNWGWGKHSPLQIQIYQQFAFFFFF